ncbi:hypothetical protein [Paenibacillus sp. AGC30]
MSLDIRLTVEDGKNEGDKDTRHNLNRMWKEAGVYEVLCESDGKISIEVFPTLKLGLKKLLAESQRHRKFNLLSTASTYRIAVLWLSVLIEEFHRYPDGVITIDQ